MMYFDSLQAVLAMDGHGAFVWSAYLVTAVVLAATLIVPVRRKQRLLRDVSGQQRRGQVNTAATDGGRVN